MKPYLLFDAGGTLVFPDAEKLAGLCAGAGRAVEPGDLLRECFRYSFEFDSHVRTHRSWRHENLASFLRGVFRALGLDDSCCLKALQGAEATNRERSLWLSTFPWVRPVLEDLRRRGYRMSVISNADGRVEQMLQDLGLAEFFEWICDSCVLGVEKPDPRIFEHTLERLDLRPEEAIYLGDIWFVDVWGPNRAGLGAIHLDPYDFYAGWPGARLRDIRGLPDWLDAHAAGRNGAELLPLKDFTLQE